MTRNALFAFALVCVACASDPNASPAFDPPAGAAGGGADVAGHAAPAGAGGAAAVDVAGSAGADVAGTGEQTGAGTSADAGPAAVAGESGSASAAGGGGVGGSAGAAEVAGAGVAGSNTAGSTGQAGAAGAAEPVVHELWTITQSNANQGGTVVATVNAPQILSAYIETTGAMPTAGLSWTFGRNDTVDRMFTTIPAAFATAGAFRASWETDGSADKQSSVTAETPAHVTYVHLVASSKLTGSTEAWLLVVSVSWTAYGY